MKPSRQRTKPKSLLPFRLPGAQSIRSRRSTITNAFVNSLMPVVRPSAAEIDEALSVLGMTADEARCAYCGGSPSGWDHLRPLVEGSRPSGHITEIANLVPCCGPCNSRKGNAAWREWMRRLSDGVSDPGVIAAHQQRHKRLEDFERWRRPRRVDFKTFVDADSWERYWSMYDAVLKELDDCHDFACTIRHRANEALGIAPKNRTRTKE